MWPSKVQVDASHMGEGGSSYCWGAPSKSPASVYIQAPDGRVEMYWTRIRENATPTRRPLSGGSQVRNADMQGAGLDVGGSAFDCHCLQQTAKPWLCMKSAIKAASLCGSAPWSLPTVPLRSKTPTTRHFLWYTVIKFSLGIKWFVLYAFLHFILI